MSKPSSADSLWPSVSLKSVTIDVPSWDPSTRPDSEFTYVDISSIDNQTCRIVEPKRVRGREAPSRARRPIQEGDVLFSNVRTYLRNVAQVSGLDEPAVASTGFTLLRPTTRIRSRYLYHLVRSDYFIDEVTPEQTGTHYPATTDRIVRGQLIPLPSLEVQDQLAQLIDAVELSRESATQHLDAGWRAVERFRQAVFAAACSGRLTADWRERNERNDRRSREAHQPDVAVPAGWSNQQVGALFRIQNGRAFPSKQYQREDGIRLLRPGNLSPLGDVLWSDERTVRLPQSWAEEFPQFVLRSGELLMNLTAQSLKDEFLGRTCLKTDSEPALLNQRIARFVNLTDHDLRPYALLYFKSAFFRRFVNGLDSGTLIRHMHSKQVLEHVMPVPPSHEQAEIVRRASAMLRLANGLLVRIETASRCVERSSQATLAKAFRGELRRHWTVEATSEPK